MRPPPTTRTETPAEIPGQPTTQPEDPTSAPSHPHSRCPAQRSAIEEDHLRQDSWLTPRTPTTGGPNVLHRASPHALSRAGAVASLGSSRSAGRRAAACMSDSLIFVPARAPPSVSAVITRERAIPRPGARMRGRRAIPWCGGVSLSPCAVRGASRPAPSAATRIRCRRSSPRAGGAGQDS